MAFGVVHPGLGSNGEGCSPQRKKETKLHIVQLAEKRRQEQEAGTHQKMANVAAMV